MAVMTGQTALTLEEQSFADRTIAAHSGKPGELLGILESLQEHHPNKYLSPDILEYVAEKTDIPLAQIYSVVTFYALFRSELLGILESLQEHHPNKYLSPDILEYVAEKTDIPLAQIYSVVTFYALF